MTIQVFFNICWFASNKYLLKKKIIIMINIFDIVKKKQFQNKIYKL